MGWFITGLVLLVWAFALLVARSRIRLPDPSHHDYEDVRAIRSLAVKLAVVLTVGGTIILILTVTK
jgi:hypothetical protein